MLFRRTLTSKRPMWFQKARALTALLCPQLKSLATWNAEGILKLSDVFMFLPVSEMPCVKYANVLYQNTSWYDAVQHSTTTEPQDCPHYSINCNQMVDCLNSAINASPAVGRCFSFIICNGHLCTYSCLSTGSFNIVSKAVQCQATSSALYMGWWCYVWIGFHSPLPYFSDVMAQWHQH